MAKPKALVLGAESEYDQAFKPIAKPTPLVFDAPRDGKIQVLVGGNATCHGFLWLPEDASLATVEDLAMARPEWASRNVVIIRASPQGDQRLKFRVDKLSRSEKEKIKVQHRDRIGFVFDRCWS